MLQDNQRGSAGAQAVSEFQPPRPASQWVVSDDVPAQIQYRHVILADRDGYLRQSIVIDVAHVEVHRLEADLSCGHLRGPNGSESSSQLAGRSLFTQSAAKVVDAIRQLFLRDEQDRVEAGGIRLVDGDVAAVGEGEPRSIDLPVGRVTVRTRDETPIRHRSTRVIGVLPWTSHLENEVAPEIGPGNVVRDYAFLPLSPRSVSRRQPLTTKHLPQRVLVSQQPQERRHEFLADIVLVPQRDPRQRQHLVSVTRRDRLLAVPATVHTRLTRRSTSIPRPCSPTRGWGGRAGVVDGRAGLLLPRGLSGPGLTRPPESGPERTAVRDLSQGG